MPVNMCVCWEVPFSRLIDLHRSEGLSLEQLGERTGCCTGCTTCEPYVRIALATGEADLPVMDARELDAKLKALGLDPTEP